MRTIDFTEEGISICFNFLQSANAFSSIEISFDGALNVTVVNDMQL